LGAFWGVGAVGLTLKWVSCGVLNAAGAILDGLWTNVAVLVLEAV